jgi:putative membrane protein
MPALERIEDSADGRRNSPPTAPCLRRTDLRGLVQLGLAALASGIGAKNCLRGSCRSGWWCVGTLLVLFSAFLLRGRGMAAARPGMPPPRPDVRRIPLHLLIAVNGFLALVALAALLGVWFGKSGPE